MIQKVLCAGLLLIAAKSLQAQEKLSFQAQTGLVLPYTDIREFSYTGLNQNLSVGAGIAYDVIPNGLLRLDLLGGRMAASNSLRAWDNQFFETSLSLDYNLMAAIDPNALSGFYLRAGLGMMVYSARSFERSTGQLLTGIPQGFNSQNAVEWGNLALLGASFRIPLAPNLQMTFAYDHRFAFDLNLDALNPSASDNFGVASLGVVARFGTKKHPNSVEVDPLVLQELKTKVQVYEAQEQVRESQRIAQIEMQNQELEMQIFDLKNRVDSLQKGPSEGSSTTAEQKTASNASRPAKGLNGKQQYRVIVASISEEPKAIAFVEAKKLEGAEIVYFEDLKTYRVVFASTSKWIEAKAELEEAKKIASDAWIAQF